MFSVALYVRLSAVLAVGHSQGRRPMYIFCRSCPCQKMSGDALHGVWQTPSRLQRGPSDTWQPCRVNAERARPASARGRGDVVVTLGVRRDCSHQQRSHTKAGQFGRFGHLPSITGAAVTCHNAAPTGNHTSPVDGDNAGREPNAG